MYCLISLPRAGSMAVYSWILESLSIKRPEYKECADLLLTSSTPNQFRKVVEIFEGIYTSKKLYALVKENTKSLTNILPILDKPFLYSETLYDITSNFYPTPLASIKVGNTYDLLYRFSNDKKYKTITLARHDIRQQFLSYIIATQSGTYHGDPELIYAIRNKAPKIYISEKLVAMWFGWLCKLHIIKKITDYTFYMEEYVEQPKKLLNELDLPEIKNYSRIVQKTKDINFDEKIENLEQFNEIWNRYCSIHKEIL